MAGRLRLAVSRPGPGEFYLPGSHRESIWARGVFLRAIEKKRPGILTTLYNEVFVLYFRALPPEMQYYLVDVFSPLLAPDEGTDEEKSYRDSLIAAIDRWAQKNNIQSGWIREQALVTMWHWAQASDANPGNAWGIHPRSWDIDLNELMTDDKEKRIARRKDERNGAHDFRFWLTANAEDTVEGRAVAAQWKRFFTAKTSLGRALRQRTSMEMELHIIDASKPTVAQCADGMAWRPYEETRSDFVVRTIELFEQKLNTEMDRREAEELARGAVRRKEMDGGEAEEVANGAVRREVKSHKAMREQIGWLAYYQTGNMTIEEAAKKFKRAPGTLKDALPRWRKLLGLPKRKGGKSPYGHGGPRKAMEGRRRKSRI